ncbi:MAG: CBS domain-containing protein [Anaerolineaceae bacterium]|nr:CBS domain-containing protein [Anaerolineaceae bacterium]
MLVRDRMTKPVITISPDTPIQEALAQMHREKIRRFPVVDERGKLLGIVSEKDILNASPSEATSLSVFEINYLLSKITIQRVMTKDVISIDDDCTIEEAARIMADKKIGSLPVMRGEKLVGIITETNLFNVFLELFGARKPGVRVAVLVPDIPGKLMELTSVIRDLGGNIISLGNCLGEDPTTGLVTVKVGNTSLETLRKALEPIVLSIVDIREVKAA